MRLYLPPRDTGRDDGERRAGLPETGDPPTITLGEIEPAQQIRREQTTGFRDLAAAAGPPPRRCRTPAPCGSLQKTGSFSAKTWNYGFHFIPEC